MMMRTYYGRWEQNNLDIYTEDKKKIKEKINRVFNAVIHLYDTYDNDLEKTAEALHFPDNDMDRAQLMTVIDNSRSRVLNSNITKQEYLEYNFMCSMIGLTSVVGPIADLTRVVVLDTSDPLDHVFNAIL
jgi:hypothetical protein